MSIELSHQAAEVLRSLPARDAQQVAAALQALKRARQEAPHAGASARAFLEARAGPYRIFYRLDREALKVALLSHRRHARAREHPMGQAAPATALPGRSGAAD